MMNTEQDAEQSWLGASSAALTDTPLNLPAVNAGADVSYLPFVPSQVLKYWREGDDLAVEMMDGRVVIVERFFFTSGSEQRSEETAESEVNSVHPSMADVTLVEIDKSHVSLEEMFLQHQADIAKLDSMQLSNGEPGVDSMQLSGGSLILGMFIGLVLGVGFYAAYEAGKNEDEDEMGENFAAHSAGLTALDDGESGIVNSGVSEASIDSAHALTLDLSVAEAGSDRVMAVLASTPMNANGGTTIAITEEVLAALSDQEGIGALGGGFTLEVDGDIGDVAELGSGIVKMAECGNSVDSLGREGYVCTHAVVYIDPEIEVQMV